MFNSPRENEIEIRSGRPDMNDSSNSEADV